MFVNLERHLSMLNDFLSVLLCFEEQTYAILWYNTSHDVFKMTFLEDNFQFALKQAACQSLR